MNEVGIVISGWQDTSPELARIRHPPHTDGYKAGMRWPVDGPLLRCGAPWSLAVQAAAVLEHGAMGSLGHHAPFHGIHQDADESEASALSRGWSAPQGFDRWSRSTSTARSGSSGWTATVTGPTTSARIGGRSVVQGAGVLTCTDHAVQCVVAGPMGSPLA